MRHSITALEIREILKMMMQQVLPFVWVAISQQGATGFFVTPNASVGDTRRLRTDSSLFESKTSSSSFSIQQKEDVDSESSPGNDLSMFVDLEGKSKEDGFNALEFFMIKDESIQQLEEVEALFREEQAGFMMEEQTGVVPSIENKNIFHKEHIATTNPVASDKNNMKTKNTGIGIDENPMPKRLMHYDYQGSLSKVKCNLQDNSDMSYSE
jgi:hypothetical protein